MEARKRYEIMRQITRLERQKRNPERVNVYLDGEFAFGLNEGDAALLRKDQQLSDAEAAALQHKDQIVKAVNQGVNLLSYRPRSTQEIRQRLKKKDFPDEVIEAAIEHLQHLNYLDDRVFAHFWIESRSQHQPRGQRALQYELRNKGVADEIIRELLEELHDEQAAAYEAALPRVRRMHGRTQHECKQKIGAFLQRRGFPYEVANQTLARLIEELQHDEPAFFQPQEEDWY